LFFCSLFEISCTRNNVHTHQASSVCKCMMSTMLCAPHHGGNINSWSLCQQVLQDFTHTFPKTKIKKKNPTDASHLICGRGGVLPAKRLSAPTGSKLSCKEFEPNFLNGTASLTAKLQQQMSAECFRVSLLEQQKQALPREPSARVASGMTSFDEVPCNEVENKVELDHDKVDALTVTETSIGRFLDAEDDVCHGIADPCKSPPDENR